MELQTGLQRIAQTLELHFTFQGRTLSLEEVFSDVGMLPALAKRADQLCSLCLGYGLGVTFSEAEDSLLGIKSVFDQDTPMTLRYLCITDVLHELMQAAPSNGLIELDELATE